MRMLLRTRWLLCALVLSTGSAARPADPAVSERLLRTHAVNIEAVIEAQFGPMEAAQGFRVVDPYAEPANEIVQRWADDRGRHQAVCALKFHDTEQREYKLRDFESNDTAVQNGFFVTHYGRCGTCSSLHDLAIYLDRRDLTAAARQCARRFGLKRQKRCFQETLGFTEVCAETWAYNARNTWRACLGSCIADYGFFNLLLSRYPGPNVDKSGRLRPCLQCDETQSGPGFQYSAGRTRRNSGIESEIPRLPAEIRTVDHERYFQ